MYVRTTAWQISTNCQIFPVKLVLYLEYIRLKIYWKYLTVYIVWRAVDCMYIHINLPLKSLVKKPAYIHTYIATDSEKQLCFCNDWNTHAIKIQACAVPALILNRISILSLTDAIQAICPGREIRPQCHWQRSITGSHAGTPDLCTILILIQPNIILSFRALRRAIEVKQHWSVIGWVTKNLLSWAPCIGRHVKPLVSAAFAVVNTHQSTLGPRGGLWLVLLLCDP
jgi:hypothetical protein